MLALITSFNFCLIRVDPITRGGTEFPVPLEIYFNLKNFFIKKNFYPGKPLRTTFAKGKKFFNKFF